MHDTLSERHAMNCRTPARHRPSNMLLAFVIAALILIATVFALPARARAWEATSFEVTGGVEGVDYYFDYSETLWITSTKQLTIRSLNNNNADHIAIDAGSPDNPARLVFDGVNFSSSHRPITIQPGRGLEITLAPDSSNSLFIKESYAREAICLKEGSSLTIKSDSSSPGSLNVGADAYATAPVIGGSDCSISLEGGLINIYTLEPLNPLLTTDADGGTSRVSITGGCFATNVEEAVAANSIYGITPADGYIVVPNPDPITSTTYPVLVDDESLYRKASLELAQDAMTIFDGHAVEAADVVSKASYGTEAISPNELSFSYAPMESDEFVKGLPQDAGTYRVRASAPQKNVEGIWYAPASAETTLTIKLAPSTYRIVNQILSISATLAEVETPVAAGGVTLADGTIESVGGTLNWYSDEGHVDALSADAQLITLAEDGFVTLWWTFVPTSANYDTLTGSTVIVLEKPTAPEQTTTPPTGNSDGSTDQGDSTPISDEAVPATGDASTSGALLGCTGLALLGIGLNWRSRSRHVA